MRSSDPAINTLICGCLYFYFLSISLSYHSKWGLHSFSFKCQAKLCYFYWNFEVYCHNIDPYTEYCYKLPILWTAIKSRSHTMKSSKALQTTNLFYCLGHTALKPFNGIATITAVIFFFFFAAMQCFKWFYCVGW